MSSRDVWLNEDGGVGSTRRFRDRLAGGDPTALAELSEAERMGIVGYHGDDETGAWVIHLEGGPSLARNLALVLTRIAVERPYGPESRDALERLAEALMRAACHE